MIFSYHDKKSNLSFGLGTIPRNVEENQQLMVSALMAFDLIVNLNMNNFVMN